MISTVVTGIFVLCLQSCVLLVVWFSLKKKQGDNTFKGDSNITLMVCKATLTFAK
jgi:hypothetical protein